VARQQGPAWVLGACHTILTLEVDQIVRILGYVTDGWGMQGEERGTVGVSLRYRGREYIDYMVSHGSLFCSKFFIIIDLSQLRHLRNLRHLGHLRQLRFCFQFYNPFARLWSGPQGFFSEKCQGFSSEKMSPPKDCVDDPPAPLRVAHFILPRDLSWH
jgi:hypothetical protein